jgi:hypothetical protein
MVAPAGTTLAMAADLRPACARGGGIESCPRTWGCSSISESQLQLWLPVLGGRDASGASPQCQISSTARSLPKFTRLPAAVWAPWDSRGPAADDAHGAGGHQEDPEGGCGKRLPCGANEACRSLCKLAGVGAL